MHLIIHSVIVLEGCIFQYNLTVLITFNRLLYWRDASLNTLWLLYWKDASNNTLDYCIEEMHLSLLSVIVLEGCIFQYNRVSLIVVLERCISQYFIAIVLERCISQYITSISVIVLEGCIFQYNRLLYWRDASLNTVDCCIGEMHLLIH